MTQPVGYSQYWTPPGAGADCVEVQLYNGNGDTLVSGDDTYAVFSVAGFISPQQFDTNSLFDGTSTIVIDADGYWEWDARARFAFDQVSTGYQLSVSIEITGGPNAGERVNQGYQQLDPGGSGVTLGGETDIWVPTTGRNMAAGDEVQLLIVAFASNPLYTNAFIHGHRKCDTLDVLPYTS